MNITSDDPRLTAYALDELDETGRSVIEAEMRNFSECRGEVEEITRAIALVRAELATEPMPALTSVQQRAIEAKLRLPDYKPGISWIPSFRRLKVGLAMAGALLICAFMLPSAMKNGIQTFSQNASVDTAGVMLKMAGAPVIEDGLKFTSPEGMSLEVARDCNTMNSSLILLAASLLLGSLYLRSPWKRVLLTLFVVPLVIVRDGLRIFTVAEFWLQMGAHRMDSPIFRFNGLMFFALSLIPFLLFLVWLRKLESKP
jgi:exosortase/archaeosortase family protein